MRLLISILFLGLAACGGDSTAPTDPPEQHAGTYVLLTANGAPLPFTLVEQGSNTVEITAGSVTLRADATFDDEATIRVTEDGEVTIDEDLISGTFTVSQGRVRFLTLDGLVYEADIDGNVMTQNFQGLVLVYER